MAEIILGIGTSHSPTLSTPYEAFAGHAERDRANPQVPDFEALAREKASWVGRELQKELTIGIPFLGNLQDRAMTETMGPIYDRTQEHLGTTDAMVIFVRRRLIDAARALRERGAVPAHVDDANLCRVRPASVLLPEGESWITATEKARQSDAGVPIAWVPFAS